jgi:hypothetical protein
MHAQQKWFAYFPLRNGKNDSTNSASSLESTTASEFYLSKVISQSTLPPFYRIDEKLVA